MTGLAQLIRDSFIKSGSINKWVSYLLVILVMRAVVAAAEQPNGCSVCLAGFETCEGASISQPPLSIVPENRISNTESRPEISPDLVGLLTFDSLVPTAAESLNFRAGLISANYRGFKVAPGGVRCTPGSHLILPQGTPRGVINFSPPVRHFGFTWLDIVNNSVELQFWSDNKKRVTLHSDWILQQLYFSPNNTIDSATIDTRFLSSRQIREILGGRSMEETTGPRITSVRVEISCQLIHFNAVHMLPGKFRGGIGTVSDKPVDGSRNSFSSDDHMFSLIPRYYYCGTRAVRGHGRIQRAPNGPATFWNTTEDAAADKNYNSTLDTSSGGAHRTQTGGPSEIPTVSPSRSSSTLSYSVGTTTAPATGGLHHKSAAGAATGVAVAGAAGAGLLALAAIAGSYFVFKKNRSCDLETAQAQGYIVVSPSSSNGYTFPESEVDSIWS